MLIIISKFVLIYNEKIKTDPGPMSLTLNCRAKMYFVVLAYPPSSEDWNDSFKFLYNMVKSSISCGYEKRKIY